MSSQNYERNGYKHELDLAIISHYINMHVSDPMRSGCRAKSVHLRPADLRYNYNK